MPSPPPHHAMWSHKHPHSILKIAALVLSIHSLSKPSHCIASSSTTWPSGNPWLLQPPITSYLVQPTGIWLWNKIHWQWYPTTPLWFLIPYSSKFLLSSKIKAVISTVGSTSNGVKQGLCWPYHASICHETTHPLCSPWNPQTWALPICTQSHHIQQG